MNLVGKIFTVLILVMSLVFMSFAVAVYATHKNWREAVMLSREDATSAGKTAGLKYQLEDARNTINELRGRLDKAESDLKQEKDAHINNLAKLKQEKLNVERDNVALKQANDELEKANSQKTQALATTEERNKQLLGESTELRATIRKVEKDFDEKADQLVQKTDDLLQKTSEVRRLDDKLADVTAQFVKAKDVLRMFGLVPDPNYYLVPAFNGLVLAVRGDGLIEISVGSDDGVRKGAKVRVIRADGSMYLGQVEVLETKDNRAVCRVIQGTQLGAIKQGDRVTYDLNDVLTSINPK